MNEITGATHQRVEVYIGARFSRRQYIKEKIVPVFKKYNMRITSRWIFYGGSFYDSNISYGKSAWNIPSLRFLEAREMAERDFMDIDKADLFLLLGESTNPGRHRGRLVEFGYAIAKGKDICILGPLENVFSFHRGITYLRDIEDLENFLKDYRR